MNKNQGVLLTSIYTFLALFVAMIFFFPLWWSFSNSLRVPLDTFVVSGLGLPWINFEPTLDNWRTHLSFPEAHLAIYNSSIISLVSTGLALIVGLPAAYALARFRFRFPPNKDLTTVSYTHLTLPTKTIV